MALPEQFQRAENEFFKLKGQLSAGRITPDQFDAALKALITQDAQGRYWMIGADTGTWYMHDGQNWVSANPASPSGMPPAPSYPPQAIQTAPPRRRSNTRLVLAIGGLMLCCVLSAVGLFAASNARIIKIGWLNPPTPTIYLPPFIVPPPILPTMPPTPIPPTVAIIPPTAPIATVSATDVAPTVAPITSPTTIPLPPTLAAPPGLYVTSLRPDPAPLGERMDAGFVATFLNTTGTLQRYRWLVYVYKADNFKNSFGETASEVIEIPTGASERKTYGSWRIGVGTCGDFVARAAWQDENKKPTFLNKPDGQLFELSFKVCQ